MLVTAVIKTRAETLLAGGFAGRVTAVATGEERSFGDCDDLVSFLTEAAQARATANRPAAGALLGDLTGRQRQVLGLVAAGRTNAELAAELGISVGTVRKHLERIYRSIGARNRAEAVARVLGSTGALSRFDPGTGPVGGVRHLPDGPWRHGGTEVHTREAGSEGGS